MQGVKRKLVYVSLYEVIGMTFSALGLALLSGTSPGSTGPLAVIITSIAVTWNFIYTTLFERWVQAHTGDCAAGAVRHWQGSSDSRRHWEADRTSPHAHRHPAP